MNRIKPSLILFFYFNICLFCAAISPSIAQSDDGASRFIEFIERFKVPQQQIENPTVVAIYPRFPTALITDDIERTVESGRYKKTGKRYEIVGTDAHWALVGFESGLITLLDLQLYDMSRTRQDCNILNGHTARITSIAITPDGKKAISGSLDSTVRIWDLKTCTQLLNHTDGSQQISVAVTPDGKHAISASGSGKLHIFDMENNRIERIFESGASVSAVVTMPDNRHAITGNLNGEIMVWDIQDGGLKRNS